MSERIEHLQRFVSAVVSESDLLSRELTEQMGRPFAMSAGEIRGFAQRAETMLKMAPQALADIVPQKQEGLHALFSVYHRYCFGSFSVRYPLTLLMRLFRLWLPVIALH